MRSNICMAAFIFLLLAGCGNNQGVTTKSSLTPEEVSNLEIRAQNNDIKALKELRMHYDFEHMYEKSEVFHKRLVDLNDDDAMIEEAERLAISAEKVADKAAKKSLLNKAMHYAVKAAKKRQINDVSMDSTVQMIQKYLDSL